MKKLQLIFCFLGLCLLLNGCALFKPVEFDYGEVSDNIYHNESFGFTLTAPFYTWRFKSPEAMRLSTEETKRDIAGNNLFRKAMLAMGSINSASILHLAKYEDNYQPNLLLKVSRKGIYDCEGIVEYMDLSFDTAERMNIRIERLSESYKTETIKGKDYIYVDVVSYWDDLHATQSIYVTEQNDFYFIFTLTYRTEHHKQELLEILRTAKFDDTYPGMMKI